MKKRVLFVCTHNSARSQMAEALLRQLAGDRFEAFSAGTMATQVHPLAVQVMSELGVDISRHRSKSLETVAGPPMDYVITVCDRAKETCPAFPGDTRQIHWGFEDPALPRDSEQDQLRVFRRVRDEIAARIRTFLALTSRPVTAPEST